ncbi:putative RNA methyltransferase [Alcanivorax hongdengensis A-11-3]|uniref:Putative RNA methyltransferase n=1 Tax=Alcanivorax hongdengensis A-11-3 TaxID=1177179 RepID=L0WEY3_9GAMM|nr:tRNA/rRNA methyltransferase [Alcanivorax hongdengensis]EKF75591.1 putative RNA methyltransferase [Alcanivorax hongdengensis A-11-3]
MDIVFVLVEPARAENVGAAARAIKTMGFDSLRLVNAGDLDAAHWVAHQSSELVSGAQHFTDLAQALTDVDLSIACTARRRLQKDRYVDADQCAALLADKHAEVERAAIVFGRESSGLTGDEVALCDLASRIPLAHPQPSLNLAQAVMVYAWELRKTLPASTASGQVSGETYARARQALDEGLAILNIDAQDNLAQWVSELLPLANQRELGLVRQLLRRLQQLDKLHSNQ